MPYPELAFKRSRSDFSENGHESKARIPIRYSGKILPKSRSKFLKNRAVMSLKTGSNHSGKRWWDARNNYVSEENQEISDDALKQITTRARAYLESENKGKKFCERRVSIC